MNDDATQAAPKNNSTPSESERTFGMLVHLLGIFTWFIGPLIVWLLKKDEMAFVDDQGKEALNFQITVFLAGIGMFIVAVILALIPFVGWILSMLLYMAFWIGTLVLLILATVAANKGQYYRYPICLRLLK
jgi:uncharacterized Tic20 family protein